MVSRYARSQMGKYNRIHDLCVRLTQEQIYIASRRRHFGGSWQILFRASDARDGEAQIQETQI